MPVISASVVMYGAPQETARCLNSLAQHTKGSGLTLYLIDNASPGNALNSLLAQGVPRGTVVLPRKQNRGYGAGHNAVLPLLSSRYHAVVNPDITIDEDVLNKMAAYMDAHPDIAILSPRLMFPNGSEQHIAKRRPALLPLLARQLHILHRQEIHYLMLDEDLSVPTDIEFCSGSFFMIRSQVFKAIGGFDEKYFMYVEDADLTQKALRMGRAVFYPGACVTHAWQRAAHRRPRQFLWQCRSMLRYFAKWGFRLS